MNDFEKRILKEFADANKANSQAFRDPDFQYMLTRAQHAYARSGDENIRETLAGLIARRSKEEKRSRLSLTLNEAVDRAAVLTINEFAELSLCYLIRYTFQKGINSINVFCKYIKDYIVPLLPYISTQASSYQYIEAHSCGIIGLETVNVTHAFRTNYAGIFSKGFDREQLESHLPDDKKQALDTIIIPCLNDSSKFQIDAINRDAFLKSTEATGLSEAERLNVWNMFDSTVWNGEDFLQNVEKYVPEIRTLYELWQNSELNHLKLNTVGIAIAHANLVHTMKFDADLSIWIQ